MYPGVNLSLVFGSTSVLFCLNLKLLWFACLPWAIHLGNISKAHQLDKYEQSLSSDPDCSRPFWLVYFTAFLVRSSTHLALLSPSSHHMRNMYSPNCRWFACSACHMVESYSGTCGGVAAYFDMFQPARAARKRLNNMFVRRRSFACNKTAQLTGLSWAQSRYSGVLRNVAQCTTGNTLQGQTSASAKETQTHTEQLGNIHITTPSSAGLELLLLYSNGAN